ncbi:UNVERIFIED_CONTAM: hypothetical protein PYX00_001254 [Menopon gallinae]|uniref:Cytochrome P450 n=1 Tax=Menopon gallinae TaxID=328185 RepID=A0AAW2ICF8_9NEOP
MITAALFALISFLILVLAILRQGRPTGYPPGPGWWPFVGNGFMLRKLARKLNGQHLALSKLAKDYGTSLLGLKLGGEYVVVGFTPSVVKEIMSRDEFIGRPDSFFLRLRCFGNREGVTGCDGPNWQKQRAFVVRHLKVFGMGKTTMEGLIRDELADLIRLLKEEAKPVSVGEILAPAILSVIWGLVAGKRLQRTDQKLQRLLQLLNRRSRAFDIAGGYLNQFPWLRFVAPEKVGYTLLTTMNAELKQFLTEMVEEHKSSYKPDVTRDLIDAFLHEMYSGNDADVFTDSQLVVVLLDLFIAGSQTTSGTLDFAFLYMIKYPEIQEKVYDCLKDTVGMNSPPKLEDKPRLAYVEAVIAEVQRLCNVVPVAGPRRCLQETKLNGYIIPKNTTLLFSLLSLHMDEELFPDPQRFHPDRFLGPDGNFIRNNNFLPFGLGKRRCLGDILAKAFIFMVFAGIIQQFKVSTPKGDPEPTLTPLPGITLAPAKYAAQFTPR